MPRLDPSDEPRLIGATQVATLRRARAELEAKIGGTPNSFVIDGLGDVAGFALETAGGAPFSLIAHSGDDSAWTILAHTVAELPAIMAELGLEERGLSWRAKADPPKPWSVIRVDSQGARTIVQRAAQQSAARRACEYWTARDAKQSWLVEKV